MSPSQKILSTKINLISFDLLLQRVCHNSSGYVCFANVHMVIEVYNDQEFGQVVNNSSFTVADGVPIQKSLQLLYGVKQERIAGMDFMPAVIKKAALESLPVFFYGSDLATIYIIKERALTQCPNLIIAGAICPPFRKLTKVEEMKHISQINKSGAKIVFVCLGCPKQEKWMSKNTRHINAILLGVGGAFETYANIKKRAPKWAQNFGLEWAFRLFQDPKRLWKRYSVTNSLFLLLISFQFFKIRVLRKSY